MHTYKQSLHEQLFTVGYFEPNGQWYPLTDFNNENDAMNLVNFLNGGNRTVECYMVEP